jgi:cytochrome c peroxidase
LSPNSPTIGGNLYQKMGLVEAYANTTDTGRAFHDGGAADLTTAVTTVARLQLGRKLAATETADIVAFLGSLSDKERAARPAEKKAASR